MDNSNEQNFERPLTLVFQIGKMGKVTELDVVRSLTKILYNHAIEL